MVSETGVKIKEKRAGLAKILEVAKNLFAAYGYDGVSVREIAKASGTSKALIYYYFKDKQDLYNSVVKESLDTLRKEFLKAISQGRTPREKIKKFVFNYFDLLFKHKQLIKILSLEGISLKGTVTSYILKRAEEIISILSEVIKEGVKKKEFKRIDPNFAALSLFGILNIFVSEQIFVSEKMVSGKIFSARALSEEVFLTFMKGIEKN